MKKQYALVTLNRTPLQADDEEITDYLSKFGTLKGPIKRRTYTEGPLKGIENGTITALISLETPIPSYHWLQGKRFEAYHRGMVKTCFWCLEPGEKCKNFMLGNGSACKASGTQKSSFKNYISNLWNRIGWDENKYNENNESSQTATGLPATGREWVEDKQEEKTTVTHLNQQPIYPQSTKTHPNPHCQRRQTTSTMILSPLSHDASLIL